MYIAIYGPPGAGKSTLIAEAIKQDLPAFDLEDGGETHDERLGALEQFVREHPSALFGAADLAPEEFPKGTICVLLLPSETDLLARVEARGDKRDHKWKAHALKVREEHAKMAKEGAFDHVISNNLTSTQTLKRILDLTNYGKA